MALGRALCGGESWWWGVLGEVFFGSGRETGDVGSGEQQLCRLFVFSVSVMNSLVFGGRGGG